MNVLLDTCTFIWMAQESEKLSRIAATIIDDEQNDLFLSDISLWEITLKFTSGRFSLPTSPGKWLTEKCDFFQLALLPIQRNAIFLTASLPPVHSDPFDRLIAAQAIENHLTILSPDRTLSLLGANRIW
jgi:PIN domain nuclease of toxin-antitoxin system